MSSASTQDLPDDMRIRVLLGRYEAAREGRPAAPLWKLLYVANKTSFIRAGAWRCARVKLSQSPHACLREATAVISYKCSLPTSVRVLWPHRWVF